MSRKVLTIAFRADASIKIGIGHVMRCLTLAETLRIQGHRCVFICRNHLGHLSELIAQKGFEVHVLNVSAQPEAGPSSSGPSLAHAEWLGASWQRDAEQTTAILSSIRPDWLVVDHYALDGEWEKQVASLAGKIMVIDDLADREHNCDLLLDQNLGRRRKDYNGLVPEHCIRLIGPHYALLRPEFSELRDQSLKRRCRPELKRILISLGGVDRNNVTGEVLNALAHSQLHENTELDIVMGASAPHLGAVRKQAETLPFCTSLSVNISDMADRMCRADLAIGAAGGTAWERCCLGLPSILIVLAKNQLAGTSALENIGAATVIQSSDQVSGILPKLIGVLRTPEKLRQMTGAAVTITDGRGAEEVAGNIERIK